MEVIFQKEVLKDIMQLFASGTAGFSLFFLTSHPRSPLRRRLPTKKVGKIHVLPSIRMTVRNKDIHFHHWFNLAVLYLILLGTSSKFVQHEVLQGFLLGGIVQGLTFKDCFRIVHPPLAKRKNGI